MQESERNASFLSRFELLSCLLQRTDLLRMRSARCVAALRSVHLRHVQSSMHLSKRMTGLSSRINHRPEIVNVRLIPLPRARSVSFVK